MEHLQLLNISFKQPSRGASSTSTPLAVAPNLNLATTESLWDSSQSIGKLHSKEEVLRRKLPVPPSRLHLASCRPFLSGQMFTAEMGPVRHGRLSAASLAAACGWSGIIPGRGIPRTIRLLNLTMSATKKHQSFWAVRVHLLRRIVTFDRHGSPLCTTTWFDMTSICCTPTWERQDAQQTVPWQGCWARMKPSALGMAKIHKSSIQWVLCGFWATKPAAVEVNSFDMTLVLRS